MYTSCQITGIKREIWKRFRQICIMDGISANKKLVRMIEDVVASAGGDYTVNGLKGIKEGE